jgi:cell wall-associated NlpC family hydrolase
LAQIRFEILLLSVGALTGCSLAGGPAAVEPSQRDDSHEIAIAVVETAYEAIGSPYQWGGNGANGFDCSGLIRYAYGQFGIELPRISRDQLAVGSPVELRVGALEPGDVLGFSAVVGGEATHVGLYIGDGQFIHSSTSGVRVSDLRQPYWQQHFMAARRMVG